ncbi:MAG: hypothetical protein KTR32_00885 [Granulosicoccus sp.]|nr:hypothetical protein [Granulosicoccus sp.]
MNNSDSGNNTSAGDNVADATPDRAAYKQTVLVYLLLLLHPLYGITALIGVIVCHMKKEVTESTVFESHRRWQIWTFWTGTLGYIAAIYYILRMGSWTILLVTMIWMLYRIVFGWWKALKHSPVGNKVAAR